MSWQAEKKMIIPIKKVWFDMILSNQKKEEYRDIKPYWVSRIMDFSEYPKESRNEIPTIAEDVVFDLLNNHSLRDVLDGYHAKIKNYNILEIRNGYGDKVPRMEIELLGIDVSAGREEWGAENGKKYFTFKLGEIITTKNIVQ